MIDVFFNCEGLIKVCNLVGLVGVGDCKIMDVGFFVVMLGLVFCYFI